MCYTTRFALAIEATGIPLHHLGETRTRKPWTIARARKALNNVMRARRIDALVTHAPWSHAMFAPVAKSLGIPVILWLHAPFTGGMWLERWAERTPPDGLLFNSRFTRDISRLPQWAVPAEVIYYPVRHQTLPGGGEYLDRMATRAELGVSHDDCVISQVARIDKYKGHRLLLSALALLPLDCKWVYWIIGAPSSPHEKQLLDQLIRYTYTLGISERVRFLGERTDIPHILAASDVAVHPNVEPEAFGIAVIEELLHGLPVVATALGGPAEILAPSYGVLVPAHDPPGLAAAIERLMSDPNSTAKFREIGPNRARELCDPATQLDKFCSFFEEIAKVGTEPRRVVT